MKCWGLIAGASVLLVGAFLSGYAAKRCQRVVRPHQWIRDVNGWHPKVDD